MAANDYLVACKEKTYKKGNEEVKSLSRVGAFFPFKTSRGGRLVIDEGIAVLGELVLVEPREGEDR